MIYLDFGDIGPQEIEAVRCQMESGFISTASENVELFEDNMRQYLGLTGKSVLATNSGTSALHLALMIAGIGPGDEVIIPATTFVATRNAVEYVGATAVIVDIEPKTWTIDCDEIERNITDKTRAIIPVHLYGVPCAMDRIMAIARDNHLLVIEDACQALGATIKDRMVGTIGDLGVFSFNGNKVLTTGAGGLLVGKSGMIGKAARLSVPKSTLQLAYNYRMTGIAAAIGIEQLKRLPGFLKKKRAFNQLYRQLLPDVKFQEAQKDSDPSWWFTAAKLPPCAVDNLTFPGRRVFKSLSNACRHAVKIESATCLPSSTKNSKKDIKEVCRQLNSLRAK